MDERSSDDARDHHSPVDTRDAGHAGSNADGSSDSNAADSPRESRGGTRNDGGTDTADVPDTPSSQPSESGRRQGRNNSDARAGGSGDGQGGGADSEPEHGPEDTPNLDPWEVHDRMVREANRSEPATLATDWGDLQCTVHMPDYAIYQAVIGSLPEELISWMEEMAEEYGDEREFEDLIEDEEVDTPRIIWGERCVKQFRRILSGGQDYDPCLEHTPPNDRDKLTRSPMVDIIHGMEPNTSLAGIAFQAIRMGSERKGVRNFRME